MLVLYIFIQILCMTFICIGSFKFSNLYLLDLFKYLPILTNLALFFNKKINIKLKFILLFIAIADFSFLFLNSCVYGIAFFIFVQIIFIYYLVNINNKSIYLFPVINLIFVYFLKERIIIIEGIIYGILLLFNIVIATKSIKKDNSKLLLKKSLLFLLVCDIFIAVKFVFKFKSKNFLNFLDMVEWMFYLISQIYFVIYALNLQGTFLYRVLQPVFTPVFKFLYNPTIINNEYIQETGSAVIAGNHKHALDPILVNVCTDRIVYTLAKKDLHDGCFGWFFRAIGTIPVDLKSATNRSALNTAVERLKEGNLINLSPEAKRNYTDELLLPFKYGAVSMAKKSNSVIVPYSITGDYKIFSRNLKIVFGKPIDISELDIENANEKLFNSIKKLLKENMSDDELKTKEVSKYRGVVNEENKNS